MIQSAELGKPDSHVSKVDQEIGKWHVVSVMHCEGRSCLKRILVLLAHVLSVIVTLLANN